MHDLHKKVAYLQGLMAGLEITSSTNEGKILTEMLTILDCIADNLQELQDTQTELESYIQAVDEDLLDLEDEVYYVDSDDELEEDELIEIQCPECKDIVYFDADLLDDDDIIQVTCPNCDAIVYSNEDEQQHDYDDHENYAQDI
jgi:endogenous inhibitor of DNA gyrase (YacG/DUF329 family)